VLGLAAGLGLLAPETRWAQRPPAAAVTAASPRGS